MSIDCSGNCSKYQLRRVGMDWYELHFLQQFTTMYNSVQKAALRLRVSCFKRLMLFGSGEELQALSSPNGWKCSPIRCDPE
jgi:hypothetical protein